MLHSGYLLGIMSESFKENANGKYERNFNNVVALILPVLANWNCRSRNILLFLLFTPCSMV